MHKVLKLKDGKLKKSPLLLSMNTKCDLSLNYVEVNKFLYFL